MGDVSPAFAAYGSAQRAVDLQGGGLTSHEHSQILSVCGCFSTFEDSEIQT